MGTGRFYQIHFGQADQKKKKVASMSSPHPERPRRKHPRCAQPTCRHKRLPNRDSSPSKDTQIARARTAKPFRTSRSVPRQWLRTVSALCLGAPVTQRKLTTVDGRKKWRGLSWGRPSARCEMDGVDHKAKSDLVISWFLILASQPRPPVLSFFLCRPTPLFDLGSGPPDRKKRIGSIIHTDTK